MSPATLTSKASSKDNSTFKLKADLRRLALEALNLPIDPEPLSRFAALNGVEQGDPDPALEPIICETHGGFGALYLEVYRYVRSGIVFEVDEQKVSVLADQRPTWSVYNADCEKALAAGAGAHMPVNLLDIDPYGEPWPVIDAFLTSPRTLPPRLVIVVNDGLRRNLRFGMSWKVTALRDMVERYGNDALFGRYLDICEEMINEKASAAGYSLERFTGYYCGEKENMTHYLAVLVRPDPLPSSNPT